MNMGIKCTNFYAKFLTILTMKHSKLEYASKELCCRFRFATAFSGKFGCNNHSRKVSFCRAEFSKQVVLLWPQNPVSYSQK